MSFARRPNATERASARASEDPRSPQRAVVNLRRSMAEVARRNSVELMRMRQAVDRVGTAALETALGTDDFNDFVNDFNALRTAVLQMDPELAVPDAL